MQDFHSSELISGANSNEEIIKKMEKKMANALEMAKKKAEKRKA